MIGINDSDSESDNEEVLNNFVAFLGITDFESGSESDVEPERKLDESYKEVRETLIKLSMENLSLSLSLTKEKERLEAKLSLIRLELQREAELVSADLQAKLDQQNKNIKMLTGTKQLDKILSAGRTENSHMGLAYMGRQSGDTGKTNFVSGGYAHAEDFKTKTTVHQTSGCFFYEKFGHYKRLCYKYLNMVKQVWKQHKFWRIGKTNQVWMKKTDMYSRTVNSSIGGPRVSDKSSEISETEDAVPETEVAVLQQAIQQVHRNHSVSDVIRGVEEGHVSAGTGSGCQNRKEVKREGPKLQFQNSWESFQLMVRTKKMAKRDIALTSWTHAAGESSRPYLTDKGSEATPPRNNLPSTALLPEITEELELFNTANEKEPSEESDDQHASSVHEEAQIDKVTATSSDTALPKPLSAPIGTVPSESHRSETPDRVTDSLLLLCHEEKDGSVEEAKEQSCLRFSSRVRSRKASERGTVVKASPVTKMVEKFLRRSIIAERLVDMTETDQWGYVEIIAKGSIGTTVSSLGNYVEPVIAEFYAGLPVTKVEADAEEIEVKVRGHLDHFSPTMINEVLNLKPLDKDEVDEETALDGIPKSELAEFLTEGTRKEWENLTTADLSSRYGALMIIAAHNWIPSTHKTHVSIDRARLVYKMAHGICVDMGRLIFKQVMNLGVVQKNDSRWLIFPRLIMSILQKQHRVSLFSGEKAQGPVVYTKDKRVGEIYEQRVAKAKGKAKEVGEGKLSSRSLRMPPHVPSPSIAPASSNRTGPRRLVVHDLGSVSILQGLLTQEDLQAVLQQTTRALQALTDIVQDLSRSVAGTCETQGLKRGRMKMYGQDGVLVVHEVRHELRHQTRTQELCESVKEH
ncbi:hypothetical protein F2Q69_00034978 [Brassica cretica]|uniref:Putative plant transposon protein domain-containing protein n=1 Tax=Brassica cretica TaxID=69181 RepID=A0A8S9SJV2_BRACR|nr:hypothetical protein F2Q69_00034978 [Brassica cretica]